MNEVKMCIRMRDPDPERGMDYVDFSCTMKFPSIPEEGQNIESFSHFVDQRVKKVSWDVDNNQYKVYLADHLVNSEDQPEFLKIYEECGWSRAEKRS